jgi:aldehyde:ferredoxin oxidoreductase
MCLEPTKGKAKYCPRHARPAKYRSVKAEATIEGQRVVFDSQRELYYWETLRFSQHGGAITLLARQQPFELWVNGVHVCSYVADFTYLDLADGRMRVIDVKGFKTRSYRLKKKLFEAVTGYEITEV